MNVDSLGEIIAERTFTLLREGEQQETIVVLLGKPHKTPNHAEFYCPYQITWSGSKKVRAIYGIDAFQALQLVLSMIGVELGILQRDTGGRLIWEADDKGDLGFPLPQSTKE